MKIKNIQEWVQVRSYPKPLLFTEVKLVDSLIKGWMKVKAIEQSSRSLQPVSNSLRDPDGQNIPVVLFAQRF